MTDLLLIRALKKDLNRLGIISQPAYYFIDIDIS